MAIGSILLILALFLLVLFYVAAPLVMDERSAKGQAEQVSALLAERERILEAILELEFDQQLGKVPEAVYASQRQRLTEKGVATLKALDELGGAAPADEDIEALIDARRAKRT